MEDEYQKEREEEMKRIRERIEGLNEVEGEQLPVLQMCWRLLRFRGTRQPVSNVRWLREKTASIRVAQDTILQGVKKFGTRGITLASLTIGDIKATIRYYKNVILLCLDIPNSGYSIPASELYKHEELYDAGMREHFTAVAGGTRWILGFLVRLYLVNPDTWEVSKVRSEVFPSEIIAVLNYERWAEKSFSQSLTCNVEL